ncbi:MAG: hypothetical protein L0196_02035 [candidate division Zixibacteria bacterium]|nr:hypothetical protein [candidate division Zixibacteria bacterium]
MKKTAYLLLAIALFAGRALAAGRLSSVSVSENGAVMLTTGSPNEFKSSWAGEAGHFKMIIELPGVTVDKTAQVLGNLAANRGIKSVRFSQFQTDPPIARVVIETPERLSYSWSTKPDGVELHFMLPSPLPAASGAGPTTTTGFAVPSTPKGTNGSIPKSADTAARPSGAGASPAPVGTTEKKPLAAGATAPATAAPDKSTVRVAAPVARQQKDSAVPTVETPGQVETRGTTTPAKSMPPAGPSPAPASGGTGIVIKPSSPIPGKPAATAGASTPAEKSRVTAGPVPSSTATAPSQTPSTAKTATVVPASPKPSSTAATPSVSGPPPAPSATTGTAKPSAVSQSAKTTAGKPSTGAAPAGSPAVSSKPGTPGSSDTVDQEKFREQLKKALGKLGAPDQPTGSKPAEIGQKTAAPAGKLGQSSFQERLKKALDPARSLTDTGEVADIDEIDTDLPAMDEEEEEPYDTAFAFPGATFMQVSPSRKVIRYHSEGRRDPFSPLTGRDRYASGKKRRAVPAAEQLRLVGIMRSLAGNKAVFEDGEGNGYILGPGERVRNGYMVSISENKVLFQVTEYGWTKTVAMEFAAIE